MKKVLAIVGPTAVGKSEFGVKCAKVFNGQIISGDSIQVYKKLDIGSAKPTKEDLDKIKHHLINIKNPFETYSVKEFQEKGRQLIDEISDQGMLPIIVGGTGLYIKALIYDYQFLDEKNEDDQYDELTNEELYNELKKKDPKALECIHINNRKRLIRALNVYEKHNIGISELKEKQNHFPIYDSLILGLTLERNDLYKRINNRVDKMINDGLIDEIKTLLNDGITFDNQCMQAIGYKEFKDYFNDSKSIDECIEQVKTNSRHFAKRQYTFFNNQLNVKWYEDKNEALDEVKRWLI